MAENVARYSHLGKLERDFARMAYDPCTDFDEAALDACQRPVCNPFGQIGKAKEAAGTASQRMMLELWPKVGDGLIRRRVEFA